MQFIKNKSIYKIIFFTYKKQNNTQQINITHLFIHIHIYIYKQLLLNTLMEKSSDKSYSELSQINISWLQEKKDNQKFTSD